MYQNAYVVVMKKIISKTNWLPKINLKYGLKTNNRK